MKYHGIGVRDAGLWLEGLADALEQGEVGGETSAPVKEGGTGEQYVDEVIDDVLAKATEEELVAFGKAITNVFIERCAMEILELTCKAGNPEQSALVIAALVYRKIEELNYEQEE